jgi:hypothetical protein
MIKVGDKFLCNVRGREIIPGNNIAICFYSRIFGGKKDWLLLLPKGLTPYSIKHHFSSTSTSMNLNFSTLWCYEYILRVYEKIG